MKLRRNPDAKMPLQCPKCQHKFGEVITRLETDGKATCPLCGTPFIVNQESIARIFSEIERIAGKFGRQR